MKNSENNNLCPFCGVAEADNHFRLVEENRTISSCLGCGRVARKHLIDLCEKEKNEAEVVKLERKLNELKKKK